MDHSKTDFQLEQIDSSVATAVGLPPELYTSDQVLQHEYNHLMSSTWIAIGLEADARNAGDVYPVEIANHSLILVRAKDQQLRVFHNVCRHRGTELVDKPCSNRNTLVCPYHAWSYGLDGTLRNTPHFNGINEHEHHTLFDDRKNLVEVRSGIWNHIVFVNLSGDAPPLEQHTRVIDQRWQSYDLKNTYRGGSDQFEIAANWKLVLENFLESYHLPMVHPELARYSPLADHLLVVDENVMGQVSLNYQPSDAGKSLPRFDNLPEENNTRGDYLLLFPNLMLSVTPDHYRITFINPINPQLTLQRWEYFFVGKQHTEDQDANARKTIVERVRSVTQEDVPILEKMQKGRHSKGFDGGQFSPFHETTVHHFQSMIAEALTRDSFIS